MHSKPDIGLTLAIASSIVVLLFWWGGAFEFIELKSVDLRFRHLSPQRTASPDVVLVAIDENSLKDLKNNRITWKWPRDVYAAVVRYLHRGGAKAIAFDMLLSEPDVDRLSTDAEQTDGALAESMKQAANVVLALQLRNEENLLADDNAFVKPPTLSVLPSSQHYRFEDFTNIIAPIPLFQESATMLGAVNYHDDSDGVLRRVHLLYQYLDSIVPQLALGTLLTATGINQVEVLDANTLKVDEVAIPIDKDGRYMVNWYNSHGPDGAFKYYPFAPLLSSAISEERNATPLVPSLEFRGKYVIIGSNATGLFDLKTTPTSNDGSFPGMEIHATILSNFLQRDFLLQAPGWVLPLTVALISLAIAFSFVVFRTATWPVVIALVVAALWLVFVMIAFHTYSLMVEAVTPMVAVVLTLTMGAVVSYQTEGKSRRKLRSMFERFVSPSVVREIVDRQESIELGGQELVCSVFFSDIKDFTTISERLTPTELVKLLNSYFTIETDIILKYGGLLDKYLGDAVMAMFGAPLPTNDHAEKVCTAALEIQEALESISASTNGQHLMLQTRIGISTGPMIVGNIGSPHRLDYTAIGDTVNLASRLEAVNKHFGTAILIAESTKELLSDAFVVRTVDRLRVKGKSKAIMVYELVGQRTSLSVGRLELVQAFEAAQALYRQRQFSEALSAFHSLTRTHPNDKLSQIYRHRCEEYVNMPPPKEWDGTTTMETK